MNDYFFYNGAILTQDPAFPAATTMWVRQGRIAAIGRLPPGAAEAALRIDLQGRTLLPAFNDAHVHIWKTGDLLTYLLDLRGARSLAEMLDKLADFARRNPANPWILARGFNEALFEEGRMPDRRDLDKVLPDRPCYVIRTCAHIAVVNTKALEISGIHRDTPAPPGGELRRDAGGELSGILTETALGLPKRFMPEYTPAHYREMILAAQAAFLQAGIGSATDPAVHPELTAVYKSMDAAGELKIRINAIAIQAPDGGGAPLPLPEPYRSDHLVVNSVKFFADGGISGKTAALKQAYKGSSEKGILRLTPGFFRPLARAAQAAGFKIATHAIGDAAIDTVLEVYESIEKENHTGIRHRIEHLGLPDAGHLARMRDLGIWCVSQPVFLYELGQNFRNYLPDFYLQNIYPYRAVLDAGVGLAFSSDAPVVRDFSPLMGIRNAVARRDARGALIGGDHCIRAAEAIRAYTIDAAAANGDFQTGCLAAGQRADFIVLEKNPLKTAVSEISDIRVLETWVGGEKVYEGL